MSQADTKSTVKKSTPKQILANPEEYFTDEVMAKLEKIAGKNIVMDKFIRTYECFDEKTCRVIIDLFENSQVKERIENAGVPTVYSGEYKFR